MFYMVYVVYFISSSSMLLHTHPRTGCHRGFDSLSCLLFYFDKSCSVPL